jgi:hypothetical protein
MRQRRVRALAQIARFNRPDYRADALDLQVEEGGAETTTPLAPGKAARARRVPLPHGARRQTCRRQISLPATHVAAVRAVPPATRTTRARGGGRGCRQLGAADAWTVPRVGPAGGADGGDARTGKGLGGGPPGNRNESGDVSRDAVTERFVAFGDHR